MVRCGAMSDVAPARPAGSHPGRHRARRASGPPACAAGIKKSGARDLALGVQRRPRLRGGRSLHPQSGQGCAGAVSRQVLSDGQLRAVILNSGGANACTGAPGFQDTHATAEAVAAALSDWGTETGAVEVAVCSTGLIGDRLPMHKVLAGVRDIVHEMAGGLSGGDEAAHAIMTTDTVPNRLRCITRTTGRWVAWVRVRACWRRRWPPCCAC